MKRLFLLLACLTVVAAHADMVARNGDDQVRITDKPCSREKILAQLSPRAATFLRDASAVVRGQTFAACWIVDGEAAHLIYEDGDQGLVPLDDFKEAIDT